MPKNTLVLKTILLLLVLAFSFAFSTLGQQNSANAATYWFIRADSTDPLGTKCISATYGGNLPHYNSETSCQTARVALANEANKGIGTGETSGGDSGGTGGDSSIPCNPTCSIGGVLEFDTGDSGGSTVTTILTVSISIAAVVAFILAGFGAVRIVTSAGNPSGINAGREMIISAISGLLFIVFAVTILEIIGANILNLPGIEATSDVIAP